MLMILALWILHKSMNHRSQYHLEVQLHLCTFCVSLQFGILQMTSVHQWGKCTFLPLFLASSITSDLFLTFCEIPRQYFLKFFPFFVQCCFCCRYLHCLRHRNKFVYQIVTMQWITSFSCNMVFMNFRYNSFPTQSLRFICFQDARTCWLAIIFLGTGHPVPAVCLFTRHSGSYWNFQFSPSILDSLFKLHILRIMK